MNARNLRIVLGGIVAVLIIWWLFFQGEQTGNAEIFLTPTRGTFESAVTVTGELQAQNSQEIRGPDNARKVRIWEMKISKLIPEGTVVKTGDFVAELDKSEITDKIQTAEVQVQKAESQFTQARLDTTLTLAEARNELVNLRYSMEESLLRKEQAKYESPAVKRQAEIEHEKSQRAYEQAEKNYHTKVSQAIAKMQEAQANLKQEQQQLDTYLETMGQFTIHAPADGMLIYAKEWNGRKKTIGSVVQAWDPVVATLPDLSSMESLTYVNEVDIQKIKEGQEVVVGLDAMPGMKLKGTVNSIANMGEQRPNSDAKVFEVKILLAENDSTLRPSMTTSNTIVISRLEDALFIPLESIFSKDSLNYVFKKSGFGFSCQEVLIGEVNENHAVVKAGLDENDRIYLSRPENADDVTIDRLPDTQTLSISNKNG